MLYRSPGFQKKIYRNPVLGEDAKAWLPGLPALIRTSAGGQSSQHPRRSSLPQGSLARPWEWLFSRDDIFLSLNYSPGGSISDKSDRRSQRGKGGVWREKVGWGGCSPHTFYRSLLLVPGRSLLVPDTRHHWRILAFC